MDNDPVRPIQAKVAKLRLWHSFPARYCYEFCRVIAIIVGVVAGTTLATLAGTLTTGEQPEKTALGGTLLVIGGVAGMAAGWYRTFLCARMLRAIIPAPRRPDAPDKPDAAARPRR